MKTAIVTGAGQDSSFLAEYLLGEDYNVVLFTKRSSTSRGIQNIEHLINNSNFTFLYGDIKDHTFVSYVLNKFSPDEYYALAAQSHVHYSFKAPVDTFNTNATAVLTQLDLIRQLSPQTKFLNASTSEMFGGINCPETGWNENSKLNPRSPYAVSKVAATSITKNYREAYNLFAISSICFNHSSIRRGVDFATRKITRGIAKVKLGLEKELRMGNLTPYRDESHAKDIVCGMHMMMQRDYPEDFVLASGTGATIKEMFEYVCELAELNFDDVYKEDPRFMRPSDVPFLKGDYSKAKIKLKWEPKHTWKDLLKEMYFYDLYELQE